MRLKKAKRPLRKSVRLRKTHFIFLVVYLFITLSVLLTPLFVYIAPDVAEFSYKAHRINCHQYPPRSPHLFGHQLPECWRCTAIFAGFVVGMILIIRLGARAKWWWLALAGAAIATDGITQLLHWRTSTNQLRMVTGFVFGMVGALWLVPFLTRLIDWIKRWWRKVRGIRKT